MRSRRRCAPAPQPSALAITEAESATDGSADTGPEDAALPTDATGAAPTPTGTMAVRSCTLWAATSIAGSSTSRSAAPTSAVFSRSHH